MKTCWAAICDDEEMSMNMIASSLEVCFQKHDVQLVLDKYTSPTDLLDAVQRGKKYQVLFLDIDMPQMDGISLGVRLKKLQEKMAIIYISNCTEKVFESFQARPFGFVRKSSYLKDIQAVVKLYVGSLTQEDNRRLEIKTDQGRVQIPISEIMYIECCRDYQFFYLSQEKVPLKCRLSMNQLEETLCEEGFLRIHQGYIVNYIFVKRIDNEYLELTDGKKLPISRRKKQSVLTQYMRLSRSDQSIIFAEQEQEKAAH